MTNILCKYGVEKKFPTTAINKDFVRSELLLKYIVYAEENNIKRKFQDMKQIKNKIVIIKCINLKKYVETTRINPLSFIKKKIIYMMKPAHTCEVVCLILNYSQVLTLRESSKYID